MKKNHYTFRHPALLRLGRLTLTLKCCGSCLNQLVSSGVVTLYIICRITLQLYCVLKAYSNRPIYIITDWHPNCNARPYFLSPNIFIVGSRWWMETLLLLVHTLYVEDARPHITAAATLNVLVLCFIFLYSRVHCHFCRFLLFPEIGSRCNFIQRKVTD